MVNDMRIELSHGICSPQLNGSQQNIFGILFDKEDPEFYQVFYRKEVNSCIWINYLHFWLKGLGCESTGLVKSTGRV